MPELLLRGILHDDSLARNRHVDCVYLTTVKNTELNKQAAPRALKERSHSLEM